MDHLCRLPGGAVYTSSAHTPLRPAVAVRAAGQGLNPRRSAMRRQDDGLSGPRWRAILEARWRTRLQEVTELSLAYHAATADAAGGIEGRHARRLLRGAVGAR